MPTIFSKATGAGVNSKPTDRDTSASRAEAKRLLKEAGAENLSFEMLNRNVDQPYKYVGTWLVDEWSKIGVKVTQKVVPTGPWFEAMRTGNFDVVVEANCNGVVNPVSGSNRLTPAATTNSNGTTTWRRRAGR